MSIKEITISLLIIGLFTVSLIGLIINFSRDNSTANDIMKNPAINKSFGGISERLNESSSDAEEQRQSLEKESSASIITAFEFAFRSILNAGTVFIKMTIGTFNIILIAVQETLQIPPIVTGTLLTILTITVILAAWRLYRAGE